MRALARLPQTLIEHHCRDRLRAWSTNAHRHVSERQALSFGQVPSAIVSATAASTSASAPTAPPLCGTRRIEPLSNRAARGLVQRGRRGVAVDLDSVVRAEELSKRLADSARIRGVLVACADLRRRETMLGEPARKPGRLAEIVAMLLELGRIDKRLDQFQRGHNLC